MTDDDRFDAVIVWLTEKEQEGMQLAAAVAGIPIDMWARERLRLAARRDIEGSGQPLEVPFMAEFHHVDS